MIMILWAMEMEHYLEYIDMRKNNCDLRKERKARTLLFNGSCSNKIISEVLMAWDDAKEFGQAFKKGFGDWQCELKENAKKAVLTNSLRLYNHV
ncbi:hypothetical protein Tco_0597258 [Tanacetum coccineum]